MNLIGGLIGGIIGGVIGGAIWVAVGYGTGYEVGWIAWGIGALCGFGVAYGCKGQGDVKGGALAAVLAVASILASKYIVVEMLINKHFGSMQAAAADMQFPGADDSQFWTSYIADQLIEQRQAEGKTIAWPAGVNPDEAEMESDYPADVWKDAASRWKAMKADEQAAFAKQSSEAMAQDINTMMAGLGSEMRQEGFVQSFGLMDILFGVLAIGTAFKVGSGSIAGQDNA